MHSRGACGARLQVAPEAFDIDGADADRCLADDLAVATGRKEWSTVGYARIGYLERRLGRRLRSTAVRLRNGRCARAGAGFSRSALTVNVRRAG